MATSEMSTAKTFTIIFVVLLIGPVMFIGSRYMSIKERFEKVNVGDSVATVRGTMGTPSEETRENTYMHGDREFLYWVWPIPELWVVGFKDDKVIAKEMMPSP
jgi:hypothetical protein